MVDITPPSAGAIAWDVPLNLALTTLESAVTAAEGNVASLDGRVTTLEQEGGWRPSDHGALTWTQDPAAAQGGAASVAGTLYLMRVPVRRSATTTAIGVSVITAGSGLTASQNLAGLYNSSGTLLATSADQSGVWNSIGYKQITLSQAVTAGQAYYIALLTNGTTPPQFLRGNSQSSSTINFNLASGSGRFVNFTGPFTALPASVTLSSANTDNNARWGVVIA